MDLLGYASFALPFFGEVFDLIWAPISGLIYMRTFGGVKGFFGGGFAFLEEFLPGTDIIPTFTITWFMQYNRRKAARNQFEDAEYEEVKMVPDRKSWF